MSNRHINYHFLFVHRIWVVYFAFNCLFEDGNFESAIPSKSAVEGDLETIAHDRISHPGLKSSGFDANGGGSIDVEAGYDSEDREDTSFTYAATCIALLLVAHLVRI